MTDELDRAVHELLGSGDWELTPTWSGSNGRPWVASQRRAAGDLVIQEFVDGVHPDGRWVDRHVTQVSRLMNVYHSDVGLRTSIVQMTATDAVEELERRLDALSPSLIGGVTEILREALDGIAESASEMHDAEPVVTHGDPNTSNLIRRVDGALHLVDWDEARLSDPVRDIGQVLWWYVRPERWSEGLAACDLPDEPSVRRRVHLWAADESADVAVGLLKRGMYEEAGEFARDALAAARGLPNPRAWWLA